MTAMIPALTGSELEVIASGRDGGAVAEALIEAADAHYQARQEELGEAATIALNRIVLLRVIDSLWVEHLTAVDDMRRSIGLRAYSQRDPLNEFKVEAFRMFDELKGMIRRDVARTIFRVSVVKQPVAAPAARMIESRPQVNGSDGAGSGNGAAAAAAGATAAAGAGQPVRAATKIGRNDPCYCGSGKKYKRCHGA
jgi:preprotein translocase subunit SecA